MFRHSSGCNYAKLIMQKKNVGLKLHRIKARATLTTCDPRPHNLSGFKKRYLLGIRMSARPSLNWCKVKLFFSFRTFWEIIQFKHSLFNKKVRYFLIRWGIKSWYGKNEKKMKRIFDKKQYNKQDWHQLSKKEKELMLKNIMKMYS